MPQHSPSEVSRRVRSLRRGNAPHGVADIVRDEQRPLPVDGDADRPSLRLVVCVEKAGEDVDRYTRRPTAAERHENHLIAAPWSAVPRSVLTDEHAIPI